jgi:hypothetical protein
MENYLQQDRETRELGDGLNSLHSGEEKTAPLEKIS